MKSTYSNMLSLVTAKEKDLSLDDMAAVYLDGLNPSILAAAFCRTYKLIVSLSKKYWVLTEEDVASISLETLDKCLQTYNSSKSSFSTYFYTCLNNEFRCTTQALSMQKRKALLYSNSYEEAVEKGFELSTPSNEEDFLFMDTLNTLGLTERELRYCQLVVAGYCNREISKIIGVSTMALSNYRKNLRKKLSHSCLDFV